MQNHYTQFLQVKFSKNNENIGLKTTKKENIFALYFPGKFEISEEYTILTDYEILY